MTIRFGPLVFDHVEYDKDGDVLYLSAGEPQAAANTYATPEGHSVRLGPDDEVIGITIVNARWLSERDGRLVVTYPERIKASAKELAPALGP